MIRRILAAAAVTLGMLALPAVAVPAAQASTSVVVYTNGMGGNWQDPAVKPGEIGFGAHWAMAGCHWTHWTGGSAYASGTYWTSPGHGYRANIALTTVLHHGSQRYFQHATITARGHRTAHLWYGSDHGLVGWWSA